MSERCRQGMLTFEPPAWDPRVIHVFTGVSSGPRAPIILVMRDDLLAGESHEEHLRRALKEMARQVQGLRIHQVRPVSVATREAHRATVSWNEAGASIWQDRVHLEPTRGERSLVTFAYTAASDDFSAGMPAFERVLASARIEPIARESASPDPASSTDPWLRSVPFPGARGR